MKESPISELLSLITTPCEGSNPFGDNINYDPDFDVLKNEIGKLGNIDLDVVEEVSCRLLKDKSKDIRVLTFLSYAILRKEKWEAYADIFEGLTTLAEQNYDALFPDRERAKQMAFKWISEDRYNDNFNDKKPTESDYDHVLRLNAALNKLKPILETKFPEGSPFPSNLQKNAQIWEKTLKPKPAAPPSSAAASAQAAPTVAATVQQSSGQTTSAPASTGPMDTPKQAQTNVRQAALFIMAQEPLKPMGYRLLRGVRWDLLEKAPPAEGGKTQLPAPNPQQRTFFQNVLEQKEWKTALDKAEQTFASGANHLWLDLQRVSATACKELGESYASIRQAILFENAYLLKRFPELPSMAFNDGTAFCDDATKDWIGNEVQGMMSGGGGGPPSSGDPVDEDLQKVNAMSSAEQIEEALDYVQNRIRTSSSERDIFRRTIMVGSLLLKAKQPDIAMSVLESMDQKIVNYSLDKWEPDLAVEAWSALVQIYKVAKVQKPQNIQLALQEKQNTILSKISQIDPRKAFSLNK